MNTKNIDFIKTKLKRDTNGYKSATGRNHKGQITMWHRGGRGQRVYRSIDFLRKQTNGIVVGLEHDPNRTAFIARIFNPDKGINNYMLAPTELSVGDTIRSNSEQSKNGHSQRLRYIPTGFSVHNLSKTPGGEAKFLRAPGSFGVLVKKTKTAAYVKLKSGKIYCFNIDTIASLGVVSNSNKKFKKLKKAGQSRWVGRRPTVRGVAMNPIDHPHGGGEGKTSGGRPSVTPWGKPTRGKITRRRI
uniref:Ribosomal protein L2 n=1 Tax=Dictyopteris divaricata TaxID=156996 RepID=A0A4Y5T7K5_9PHAE|nr:ribosomal protein L2 [Dictyopteris divaricata]QDB64128.1 ribosomal protein L2 [Dictyopteris divaricata]